VRTYDLHGLPKNEKAIINATLTGLLKAGYEIAVHGEDPNGCEPEDLDGPRTRDRAKLGKAIGCCDETYLLAYKPEDDPGEVAPTGWVWFIHGNGNNGCDVLSDYTVNLEPCMKRAIELPDELH